MTSITVVVGGQFGSEAKGATVAYLARPFTPSDCVIRVAGPNAGHTAYDETGRPWKLRSVPVAAVVNADCQLHIAAGSEVDLDVLSDEIESLEKAGIGVRHRLTVHPAATVLTESDINSEKAAGLVGRIGSTGKGIGSARSNRIMRRAVTYGEMASSHMEAYNGTSLWHDLLGDPGTFDLSRYSNVVIEGTQGYGLGLHTPFYPQVTSSDCRAIDFLAMAGISPWSPDVDTFRVLIVARAYPIRVAGNSGPLENETTWADLGLPEEHTTVTNKIRRVGGWDDALLAQAIEANGGGYWNDEVELVLTMIDQRFPEVADKPSLTPDAINWIRQIEGKHQIECVLAGTGPKVMFSTQNLGI